jgi:hypothetical protein
MLSYASFYSGFHQLDASHWLFPPAFESVNMETNVDLNGVNDGSRWSLVVDCSFFSRVFAG